MQTLGEPFHGDVRLARRLGLNDAEIRDVVRFTAELGRARAVAALAELDLAPGTWRSGDLHR
jgi:hypothetical protein